MPAEKPGTSRGLPEDWRRPTWARIKASIWNMQDPRILPPKVYGWGLGINLYALLRRLGVAHR